MLKQEFLVSLGEKLLQLGLSEDDKQRYLKQFERYFNTLSEQEVAAQIDGYDRVDVIASNILALAEKKRKNAEPVTPDNDMIAQATDTFDPIDDEMPVTREFSPSEMPAIRVGLTTQETDAVTDTSEADSQKRTGRELLMEELNDMERDSFENDFLMDTGEVEAREKKEKSRGKSRTDTAETEPFEMTLDFDTAEAAPVNAPVGQASETEEAQEASCATSSVAVAVQEEEPPNPVPVAVQDTRVLAPVQQPVKAKVGETRVDMPRVAEKTEKTPAAAAEEEADVNDFAAADLFEEPIPACGYFYGMATVSAVLWIPLLCLALSLYGIAYAGLGIIIGLLIAALVGVIILGTGGALVGIIYGISQLGSAKPIGLYEIGLGIAIGGGALLFGVLIYSAAVRFMPWVIRKMNIFTRFSARQLRRGIRYFKKACLRF